MGCSGLELLGCYGGLPPSLRASCELARPPCAANLTGHSIYTYPLIGAAAVDRSEGGAGAVLGAARAVGALKPAGVEVHFIVAACENMVSERAMRPGDILTASNDKTIEVLNTDAEGRLTLADALVYAEALGAEGGKLDAIVDVATLTGACIIALGDRYAGLWASTDGLATQLQGAAERSGELVWRMPLASEYSDELKSPIADLKNVGGRAGSSISAALFLKEFVKEAPWAHIDIAGPVWSDKTGGATGYGVRMLYRFVEEAGASK